MAFPTNAQQTKAHLNLLFSMLLAAILAIPLMLTAPVSTGTASEAVLQSHIEGTYAVNGKNPDGSRYQGRVTITLKNKTAFFHWKIKGDDFYGQGQMIDGRLVVDWGQNDPVIYLLNSDGTLHGTWDAGRASETLQKLN